MNNRNAPSSGVSLCTAARAGLKWVGQQIKKVDSPPVSGIFMVQKKIVWNAEKYYFW
jgi:hypothetical protein